MVFPIEIVVLILTFLANDSRTLFRCALVARSWVGIAGRLLWEAPFETILPQKTSVAFSLIRTLHTAYAKQKTDYIVFIRHLHLPGLRHAVRKWAAVLQLGPDRAVTVHHELAHFILQGSPVRIITFDDSANDQFLDTLFKQLWDAPKSFQLFSAVNEVHCRGKVLKSRLMHVLSKTCHGLQRLYVSMALPKPTISNHANFADLVYDEYDAVRSAISRQTHLKKLVLERARFINSLPYGQTVEQFVSATEFFRDLPHDSLTEVSLCEVVFQEDGDILYTVGGLPNLRVLKLIWCTFTCKSRHIEFAECNSFLQHVEIVNTRLSPNNVARICHGAKKSLVSFTLQATNPSDFFDAFSLFKENATETIRTIGFTAFRDPDIQNHVVTEIIATLPQLKEIAIHAPCDMTVLRNIRLLDYELYYCENDGAFLRTPSASLIYWNFSLDSLSRFIGSGDAFTPIRFENCTLIAKLSNSPETHVFSIAQSDEKVYTEKTDSRFRWMCQIHPVLRLARLPTKRDYMKTCVYLM